MRMLVLCSPVEVLLLLRRRWGLAALLESLVGAVEVLQFAQAALLGLAPLLPMGQRPEEQRQLEEARRFLRLF